MKRNLNTLKWKSFFTNLIFFYTALAFIIGGLLLSYDLHYISYLNQSDTWDYINNIIVEAHGLFFDLLVLGILLVIYENYRSKEDKIKENARIINSLRGGRSQEVSFRTIVAIRELNELNTSKLDLRNFILPEINLSNINLEESNLDGINLERSILQDANLNFTNIKNANLKNIVLENSSLLKSDLSYVDMRNSNLKKARMRECILIGANLEGCDLSNANLTKVVMFKEKLINLSARPFAAKASAARKKAGIPTNNNNINDSETNDTKSNYVNLSNSKLNWVSFRKAILMNTNFINSDLIGVDFSYANLSGADLRNTDLRNTTFLYSILLDYHDVIILEKRYTLPRFVKLEGANVGIEWFEKLQSWKVEGIEKIKDTYIIDSNGIIKTK